MLCESIVSIIILIQLNIHDSTVRLVNHSQSENIAMDSVTIPDTQMLSLYMEEWKEVIKTQMHFNDLIIRFRSLVLAAFGAMLGALIALMGLSAFQDKSKWFWMIVSTLSLMWTAAYIIDYHYYFQMLLGAVEHAEKLDEFGKLFNPSLFGLTDSINQMVTLGHAKIYIHLYYVLPLIALIIVSIIHLRSKSH